NSLLQAMASGRPIVATDVGDVADMVAPANRPFVVAKADEAAFSRALLTLAQQPELRECLGTMNPVRAQNISLRKRCSRPTGGCWRNSFRISDEAEVKVLVLTSLYPNDANPQHGIFVENKRPQRS